MDLHNLILRVIGVRLILVIRLFLNHLRGDTTSLSSHGWVKRTKAGDCLVKSPSPTSRDHVDENNCVRLSTGWSTVEGEVSVSIA